jgi:hypothetical protein
MRRVKLVALFVLITLSFVGCAAIDKSEAKSEDKMLVAAGFQMLPADNPKRVATLKSMPPLKLQYHVNKDGKPLYWYADPYNCNCIYTGDGAAYQKFEEMSEQREIAELNAEAATNWDWGWMGGPWGYYYD